MAWRAKLCVLACALGALGGCARVCPATDLAPLPAGESARFLVVAESTRSTELALLRSDGSVIPFLLPDGTSTEAWLGTNSNLETVTAPSPLGRETRYAWSPAAPGHFLALLPDARRTILDIGTNGTATEIPTLAPISPEDVGGLEVQDAIVTGTGDALLVWASRGAGMAAGAALGDDVALFETSGEPVDVVSLRDAVGPSNVAGPNRLAWVEGPLAGDGDDVLVVGLHRGGALPSIPGTPPDLVPESFDEGAFTVVDPATRIVTQVVLVPGLVRCADVAVSGVGLVIVGCRGRAGQEASTAGIVLFEVGATSAREVARYEAGTRTDATPSRGLFSLARGVAGAISAGDPETGRDDVLFVVGLESREYVRLASRTPVADDDLTGLGSAAYDPSTSTVIAALERSRVLRATLSITTDAGGVDRVALVSSEELPVADECRLTPRHARLLALAPAPLPGGP